jgi:protein DEK
VDLTPKKATIKLMIQKELEKLAEEADESEEDEEDAGKSEGRTTGQKA